MKKNGMALILSLLFISANGFSFEAYDYTPMDYDEYIGGNDNYDRPATINPHKYSKYRNNQERVLYKKKLGSNELSENSNGFTGTGKSFVFDPKSLRWFAYYNGNVVNSGRASGGRYYCSDIHRPCKTPAGTFRIGHKGGPDCKSSKYPVGKGNAPMPWCMFFHHGFAIHGSWSVPNYNASHGCIRVPPPDARWLNMNFLSPGTKVVVRSYH